MSIGDVVLSAAAFLLLAIAGFFLFPVVGVVLYFAFAVVTGACAPFIFQAAKSALEEYRENKKERERGR